MALLFLVLALAFFLINSFPRNWAQRINFESLAFACLVLYLLTPYILAHAH